MISARWSNRITAILAVSMPVVSMAWGLDIYRMIGLTLFGEQVLALILALALPLAFLQYRASGRKSETTEAIPVVDLLLALLGFVCGLYVAYYYPQIFENLHARPVDAMVVGGLLILCVLEGLRRAVGNFLAGVTAFFLVFALIGHLIPGDLQGRKVAFDRLLVYLAIDSNGMLGVPLVVSATIVVAFVFFGNLLSKSGGADFFTDISMALMGRYRGGSAKIAVTASSLFGSISGSAVSNVASTGIITIPLMKKGGFRSSTAGAIEAVASTGGQMMPPVMGAAAFLMAEMLQIAYAEVVIAALVPALLYYLALFVQADLLAARQGITSVSGISMPKASQVFKRGWLYLLPFAVLILVLFVFNERPENAAFWAACVIFPVGVFLKYAGSSMSPGAVVNALSATGRLTVDIILIGAAAGIIIGVLNISSLGFALTLALINFAGGNPFILLMLAAVVSIILGMGMPTVGVYILLATMVAPALIELGVQPIAAHLFVLYFGMMSMITPPVAIAAFAAAVIAEAPPVQTAIDAMRFAWLAYIIPFVFVFVPEILLVGNPWVIALILTKAVFGITLISIALAGFFAAVFSYPARAFLLLSGGSLLLPLDIFLWSRWISLVLGAFSILLLTRQVMLKKGR